MATKFNNFAGLDDAAMEARQLLNDLYTGIVRTLDQPEHFYVSDLIHDVSSCIGWLKPGGQGFILYRAGGTHWQHTVGEVRDMLDSTRSASWRGVVRVERTRGGFKVTVYTLDEFRFWTEPAIYAPGTMIAAA